MQDASGQDKRNTPSDYLNEALWEEDYDAALKLARSLPVEALNKPDHFDCLPLSLAVIRNQMEIVSILLERGVSPEAIESSGKTPMDIAVSQQNEYAIAMMTEAVELRRQRVAEEFRAAAEAVREAKLHGAVENVQGRLRAARRPKVRIVP